MPRPREKKVVIVGAGPAGLTAAYELCKLGVESAVIEKDDLVGGLSRTVNYKGYHFDIGGHRFFTKVKAVEEMWREVLPNGDFLRCKRLSRIYYDKKFFHYPIRIPNVLKSLGLWNSLLISLSYLRAKLLPEEPAETFEQYVSNHFGKRLYSIFFKSYTEKVWGLAGSEITAEWAAQRIKGLSLRTALLNAVSRRREGKDGVIRTLADEFYYPRMGPGMMWETVARMIERSGSQIHLGAAVEKIIWARDQVRAVEVRTGGESRLFEGTDFISSMPIREMIQRLTPHAPAEVIRAANSLNYRGFITVALIINRSELFPDHWIYIHEPGVRLGRIQNFKNWSPEMVPDEGKTCLGLEYFCSRGEGLWSLPDEELVELGKRELEKIGLARGDEVEDGIVIRMPNAYPIYDSAYRESLQVVRRFLGSITNLQTVGRNGMHKYNNQDHSMLTAMLAVKNILGAGYDLWRVNFDQEYHEESRAPRGEAHDELRLLASSQPRTPERVAR
ncbi:MAG TPA: NAD(P)/FAD-dependent oxidoreductase [Pyrinomonadaceae bacterium]|nr:NAD(P)/FAD-dependent oxidoreductase [Pyrinomonadaceae bacterium]